MDADAFVSGREPVVLPRAKKPVGRPTLYSPDIVDEFCGLLVDGLTVSQACKQIGIARRIIFDWKKKHSEFKASYDNAVTFRNQCLIHECIDIADEPLSGDPSDSVAERKLRIDLRWKRLQGMGLKATPQPR